MSDKVAHRYDIACGEDCRGPGLERAKDGDWVAFEDYEVLQKKLEQLREALESIVNVCPNDCTPVSNCWKCQIALEALGLVDEHGQPINEGSN